VVLLRLLLSVRVLGLLALLSGWSPIASAISLGYVEDFEDGTTRGWDNGGLAPNPVNVSSGGPAGAGDAFLQIGSLGGGGGPGSRLVVYNRVPEWTGDYLAAGVDGISLDVNNLGQTDLVLRLLIGDPVPGSPANSAITPGIALPAGSGWVSIQFSLAPQDLLPRTGTVEAALAGAVDLRLFHNPAAAFPGPGIVAMLGVDNVRAVPEPGSGLLLAGGALALCAARGRVTRRAPRGRCRRGAAASR
jgi:hypothetical protein